MNPITRSMKDTLAAMLDGPLGEFTPIGGVSSARRPTWDTMVSLQAAGLVIEEVSGAFVLTEAGRSLAVNRKAKLAGDRLRRNAAARGRSDAMRSLGMTRTRYGWE